MNTRNIKILISGASIAGLSTAYWLVKYGFSVTIIERAPHLRPGGQALDVRGPALEVASRMGILETIRNNSTKLKGMSVVDVITGKEIYSSTERTFTGGKLDSPDIEILRDDLCRVLFQATANQVKYIFNNSIKTITEKASGVEVTFLNGASQRFDLIVGADGLRSMVRKLVFGPDKQFLRYLGYYIATFNMPNILDLDHWEVFFQHEENMLAVCIATDKHSEAKTYLGFAADQPLEYDYKDISAQKQLLTERVAAIGETIPKFLECMQHSSNFYFDSMNQVVMDNWVKDSVVLVGDAAYSVSPALGQGTTIAMVGAYVLAGELYSCNGNFSVGLSTYENELREYIHQNQEQAFSSATASTNDGDANQEEIPDFGKAVIPFTLKNYF